MLITYRVRLDVPRELVLFVSRLHMTGAGRRSASPGAAISSLIAPLVWVFKLSQISTMGPPSLLARAVQQPGVLVLGEPLALVPARMPAGVHPVDQPRPLALPDRDQRSQRHPGGLAPAGHRDHRGYGRAPQVRPFGGLRPWPDSSSKQTQAPRSAAALL